MNRNESETYLDAVRRDDVEAVRRMLQVDPSLVNARGHFRTDGMIISIGGEFFDQLHWVPCPTDPDDPNDPRFSSTPLCWTRNDKMVRVLAEHGADVNAKGCSGYLELPDWHWTPMGRAAHDGRITSVRLLVERGADVNVFSPDGCNEALHTAVENGHLPVCDYLLAQGARPDIITSCMLGLVDKVKQLLESDPTLTEHRDQHTRTPLDAAQLNDDRKVNWQQTEQHDQVAEFLIARRAKWDVTHAAKPGRFDWVRQTVKADPSIAQWKRPVECVITGGARFETPLQVARRRGHEQIAQFLAERGAE